jgi:serine protease AprX
LQPTGTIEVESTETFSGTLGPSVADLMVATHSIEVGAETSTIRARLGWTGGVDLDLYLVGPGGQTVASGATLSNPEVLEFRVTEPGTYTYRVTGYATVLANYTLQSTQMKLLPGN